MGNCLNAHATYPGNRREAQRPYQPADDDYKQVTSTTAVAQAHFVTCPGGNALKLVGKPNRSEEVAVNVSSSGGLAKYIQVTLPPNVHAGDIIHVKAPDGRMNAITVPDGMGPGSTFTVEFSDNTPSPPKEEELTPGVYVPTVVAVPEMDTGVPYQNPAYASVSGGLGAETAVAQPTTGPYVPAYAAK